MTHSRKLAVVLAICLGIGGAAFAYDPPSGGALVPLLGSAQALAYGDSVTALDAPWADRLNPAASAAQQRTVIDAGATALTDFGGSQGFGAAAALGLSLPKPYAVWSAGLSLVSTPSTMTAMPLGTVVTASGGIAKDLFPNFYLGAGLDAAVGDNGGFGWGAGLDLGLMHKVGDFGPFKEFRWGAAMTGIGKGYSTPTSTSAYPAPFTLSAGARGLLIKTEDWKLSAGLDLSAPSFQDLGFGVATGLSWKDRFTFRLDWAQYLSDLTKDRGRILAPSFGVTAVFPISSSSSPAKAESDQAEVRPAIAATPLYKGVWAVGASASVPLGTIDNNPPKITVSFPTSKWGPVYISPNNDGIQDSLEIPIKITDERYVVGWTFTIVNEKGEVVRHIINKETRPETEGFKGFMDRLTYIKKGVLVPDKLVWNGVADSGQVVPDGSYKATIEAVDDNGNRSSAGPFSIVVDNTPPTLSISVPENPPVFSPDGDGNKDTILVKLSGSVEDLWTGQVSDAAGKAVRGLKFESASPSDWTWDGKDDAGKVVPDGVYSFSLSSTDRAGNSVSRRFDNIVVNTQQPPVGLVIDLAYFSPNGDSSKDHVTLFPSVPVKSGIIGWKLSVLDRAKREVWSVSGQDASSLKDRYTFDGRDTALKVLPEGQYQALVSVTYLNGYNPKANSPNFILDVTAPTGTVSVDRQAFNPAGAEGQNTVRFSQRGTKDAKWTAEISGSDGKAVKTYSFSPLPDPEVEWDGLDDSGKPVPDGVYSYRLKALDSAGNSFASAPLSIALDTVKKDVRLTADYKAFSPIPGSAKDRLTLTAQVQANENVKSYELAISPTEAGAAAVRVWKDDKGVPSTFVWDGTTDSKAKAPDGRYVARLHVNYLNGDAKDAATAAFVIDTVAPSIQVSAAPLLFSPLEGSKKKVVRFTQKSVPGDDWAGTISGPDGTPIRIWGWRGQVSDFVWDGTDEAGNTVPDGNYRYDIASIDAAGNKGSASVPLITVDQRPVQVFVTASESGISPNGDGYKDTVTFNLIVKLREGIDEWRFSILDKDGVERSVFSGKGDDVPTKLVWDGRDASGAVAQGYFTGVFTVDYLKGLTAQAKTGKILVNVDGPKAEVSLTPDLFSPDNDGYNDELTIGLAVSDLSEIADWRFEIRENAIVEGAKPGSKPADRLFKSWSGTGAPAKSLVWDGRSDKGELVESATDYPFIFTVRDVLGNTAKVEGSIAIDVLVIREGDRLKIKVPSIVFRPSAADFGGLDQDTLANNMKVIKRIAQILNKFKDYSILIEGHANSEGKIGDLGADRIAKEESDELLPLSSGRAELVKKLLTDNAVDPRRLSTAGKGSSEPVVDFHDATNRWKNRRVEFILIKSQGSTGTSQ